MLERLAIHISLSLVVAENQEDENEEAKEVPTGSTPEYIGKNNKLPGR